jgi:hypothetical protein
VIKEKKFLNGCRLSLIELSDNVWAVVFLEKGRILKAKSFMLGYCSATKNVETAMARREYKLWLETYWRKKTLSNDDSDFMC